MVDDFQLSYYLYIGKEKRKEMMIFLNYHTIYIKEKDNRWLLLFQLKIRLYKGVFILKIGYGI